MRNSRDISMLISTSKDEFNTAVFKATSVFVKLGATSTLDTKYLCNIVRHTS